MKYSSSVKNFKAVGTLTVGLKAFKMKMKLHKSNFCGGGNTMNNVPRCKEPNNLIEKKKTYKE